MSNKNRAVTAPDIGGMARDALLGEDGFEEIPIGHSNLANCLCLACLPLSLLAGWWVSLFSFVLVLVLEREWNTTYLIFGFGPTAT